MGVANFLHLMLLLTVHANATTTASPAETTTVPPTLAPPNSGGNCMPGHYLATAGEPDYGTGCRGSDNGAGRRLFLGSGRGGGGGCQNHTQTGCDQCSPGQFMNVTGSMDRCYRCPDGHFASGSGSTACTACPIGRFSSVASRTQGSTRCVRCFGGKTTASEASTSIVDCLDLETNGAHVFIGVSLSLMMSVASLMMHSL